MKSKVRIALSTLAICMVTLAPAFAWEHPRVHEVNSRRENQHDRIQWGINHGRLSAGELAQLHREGHQIHLEERDMRRMDGGHLTHADKVALNQQLNRRSNQIWRDNHN